MESGTISTCELFYHCNAMTVDGRPAGYTNTAPRGLVLVIAVLLLPWLSMLSRLWTRHCRRDRPLPAQDSHVASRCAILLSTNAHPWTFPPHMPRATQKVIICAMRHLTFRPGTATSAPVNVAKFFDLCDGSSQDRRLRRVVDVPNDFSGGHHMLIA